MGYLDIFRATSPGVRSIFTMEEELASDYFRMHLKVLKWLGIPVRPLRHRTFVNVVYCIYAVVFVTIMAIMLIVTEAIDLFLHLDDMDRLSFGLCYLVTHILGEFWLCVDKDTKLSVFQVS